MYVFFFRNTIATYRQDDQSIKGQWRMGEVSVEERHVLSRVPVVLTERLFA